MDHEFPLFLFDIMNSETERYVTVLSVNVKIGFRFGTITKKQAIFIRFKKTHT